MSRATGTQFGPRANTTAKSRKGSLGAHLPTVVVGVDLGTSGVRAVAFDEQLRATAEATRVYEINVGEDGSAEQDVLEVAEASIQCIAEVAGKLKGKARVLALSLSGTASSLALFTDGAKTGKSVAWDQGCGFGSGAIVPLTSAWTWADVRAVTEAMELRQELGIDAYRRTGCPPHASYWPAKLLWWQRNGTGDRPLVFLAGIKDYLVYRLTGEWVTDETIAAATGLYNSHDRAWDTELLERLGVTRSQLPKVIPTHQSLTLTSATAERLGLDRKVEVVAGSLDGVLAHIGLGCVAPRLASCTIGTSGAVRLGSGSRVVDRAARTWTYPLSADFWVIGGAVNNGGNVLTWLSRLVSSFAQSSGGKTMSDRRIQHDPEVHTLMPPDRLVNLAMQSTIGARGLLFVPHLYGERSPLWREDLKGALIGLVPTHDASDIARAVVEGVSLGLNGVYRALTDQAGKPEEVRASGGFIASPEWVQLQADVFGCPVAVTNQQQSVALGAAMVGWYSMTGIPLEEMAAQHIKVAVQFEPRETNHAMYSELFATMESLRDAIWPRLPLAERSTNG